MNEWQSMQNSIYISIFHSNQINTMNEPNQQCHQHQTWIHVYEVLLCFSQK